VNETANVVFLSDSNSVCEKTLKRMFTADFFKRSFVHLVGDSGMLRTGIFSCDSGWYEDVCLLYHPDEVNKKHL
jgi:hypothetical protein